MEKFVDLHQHSLLSANMEDLKSFNLPAIRVQNLSDLTYFAKNVINPLLKDESNIRFLLESNFNNAIKNNVTFISSSVDYTLLNDFNSINDFCEFLSKLREKYSEKLKINYDLGISRNNFKDGDEKIIFALLDTLTFGGIDLYGDEMLGEKPVYVKIYRYARNIEILRKAHIGEMRDGKEVKKLYKKYKLNEIQHGISIAENKKLLKYFSKKNVVFNICPTSNFILKKIPYSSCVAKIFYENKVKFTVASDDYLFFNQSPKDEYLKLLSAKNMTLSQLEEINKFSFEYISKAYSKFL